MGRALYEQEDKPEVVAAKILSYLGRAYMPPVFPSPSDVADLIQDWTGVDMGGPTKESRRWEGGYGFEQIRAAIERLPDYRGRVRTLAAAVQSVVFGTKMIARTPSDHISRGAKTVLDSIDVDKMTIRKDLGLLGGEETPEMHKILAEDAVEIIQNFIDGPAAPAKKDTRIYHLMVGPAVQFLKNPTPKNLERVIKKMRKGLRRASGQRLLEATETLGAPGAPEPEPEYIEEEPEE